jgi:hypothetical protein
MEKVDTSSYLSSVQKVDKRFANLIAASPSNSNCNAEVLGSYQQHQPTNDLPIHLLQK